MIGLLVRRVAAMLAIGGATLALVACGSDETEGEPARWDARGVQESVEPAPFVPTVINSGLGVGENRVAVALFDRQDGSLIADASVRATFYRLAEDPEADPETAEELTNTDLVARTLDLSADAHHSDRTGAHLDGSDVGDSHRPIGNVLPRDHRAAAPAHEDDLTTVYTTVVMFDRAGQWGAVLDVELGGETYRPRIVLTVQEHTSEPAIGEPAPRSEQPTLSDVEDITQVSTAQEPVPEMLDDTVAEALETGKPVVIAFATPAFCQTRFCGPIVDVVVVPAWQEYGERVEFVHIEPYDLTKARGEGLLQPVPVVEEWGLRSEPFIFVVDADGIIRAKLEGITDYTELSEAIEAVLAESA